MIEAECIVISLSLLGGTLVDISHPVTRRMYCILNGCNET